VYLSGQDLDYFLFSYPCYKNLINIMGIINLGVNSRLLLYPGVIQIKRGDRREESGSIGSRVEPLRFEEPFVAKEKH